MKFKKVLQSIIIMSIVSIIFLIGLTIYIFPSPQQVAKFFKHNSTLEKSSATALNTQNDFQTKTASNTTITNSNSAPTNEDLAKGTQELPERDNKNVYVIKNILAEDPSELRVCENLGIKKLPKSNKLDNITDYFSDEYRGDATVEAFRYPIKAILQDDSLQPLFDTIFKVEEMDETDRDSFFSKAAFLAQVTRSLTKLYQKKSYFEQIGDRANHLNVIAQIIEKKPELISDPKIKDYCFAIQSSIANRQPIDIHTEREDIIKLIAYSGLTASELNFDPNSYMKFKIKNDQNAISFSLTDHEDPETADVQHK